MIQEMFYVVWGSYYIMLYVGASTPSTGADPARRVDMGWLAMHPPVFQASPTYFTKFVI